MTTKTFTLIAEIEYDSTSTSSADMAIPMHQLLEKGLGSMGFVDKHGELDLNSCEVLDDPPEEEPPKLFDEDNGLWTEHGHYLAAQVRQAIHPIIQECLKDGIDLQHATLIAQREVTKTFLKTNAEWLLKRAIQKGRGG